jgi:flagellar biosynthesis GTPase FlhF
MSNTMQKRVEEEAARFGMHKARGFGGDRHRISWEIKCSRCPKEYRAFWAPHIATEAMLKTMRQRGWNVGVGMRPLCPECFHGKAVAPVEKPDDQSFDRFIPPAPTTAIYHALLDASENTAARKVLGEKLEKVQDRLAIAQVNYEIEQKNMEEIARQEKKARRDERQQRREARRAQRLLEEAEAMKAAAQRLADEEKEQMGNPSLKITHTIFQLLDSVFDGNKKLYRSGYNDARVAKDCGTTEDVVAAVRREVYGELSDDPRLATIRDDIALVEMQIAEANKGFQQQLADLRSRVEQVRVNLLR